MRRKRSEALVVVRRRKSHRVISKVVRGGKGLKRRNAPNRDERTWKLKMAAKSCCLCKYGDETLGSRCVKCIGSKSADGFKKGTDRQLRVRDIPKECL